MRTPGVSSHSPPAMDPPLRAAVLSELLALVVKQARRVPPQTIATTALLSVLVGQYLPWHAVALWFTVVTVINLTHYRVITGLPEREDLDDDQKLTVAAMSFTLNGMFLASAMTAYPLVPPAIGAVISIYNIGMAAATLHATMGFARIYTPYCLVSIAPVALYWGFAPGVSVTLLERLTFVGMATIFVLTMLTHARSSFSLFTEAVRMRQQRAELNIRLQQALERAELANAAKTRFLASASHDLRQPIHALTLFSGSLSLRPLDERSAAIARQIESATTALGTQLDALLDISRLDAGVVQKNLATLDLSAMLQQLLQELSPLAAPKSLVLRYEGPSELPVRSDAGLLLRVLRNLLSNAVKYTEAGAVTVTARVEAGHCELAIRDTGPGIPAADQERVFEEFYQLGNAERDRSKGLGLGLAIVRRLTALLDIPLVLQSLPGEGCCFLLRLPLASSTESRLEDGRLTVSQRVPSSVRVLVVDDEESVRLGMQTLLEEMGFAVRLAATGSAALQLSREWPPTIALVDFRLRGGEDGLSVIAALRTLNPQLPALLVSGDTAPDRLQAAQAQGLVLLHKPLAAAPLKAAIFDAVDRPGAA